MFFVFLPAMERRHRLPFDSSVCAIVGHSLVLLWRWTETGEQTETKRWHRQPSTAPGVEFLVSLQPFVS